MSQKRTVQRQPPLRGSELPDVIQQWLLALQTLLPLIVFDTSAGPEVFALPNPGLNNSQTGQTNQNQEIIVIKSTADVNTVSITGAVAGTVILTSQYAVARFKSDATSWWVVGIGGSIAPVIANFANEETPGGAINSSNLIFTLANAPSPPKSLELFYNGLIQKSSGGDFTLVGLTITFASAPTTGSTLLAWYRY